MLEFKNLEEVFGIIDKWEVEVEAMVTEVARGITIEAFHRVTQLSAQFSGDFAANWKYSINHVDTTFQPGLLPIKVGEGRQIGIEGGGRGERIGVSVSNSGRLMGDIDACFMANQLNAGRPDDFKLGDTVYISNSAAHDEPYAILIEENRINFRPGNQGKPVQRTVDFMRSAYEVVTRGDIPSLRGAQL